MPKNYFAEEVQWTKISPTFAINDERICKFINRRLDKWENSQMGQHWTYVELNYSFIGKGNNKLITCGKCFATLVLLFISFISYLLSIDRRQPD